MKIPGFVISAISAALLMLSGLTTPVSADTGRIARLEDAVCERLFNTIRNFADKLSARASRVRDLELTLTRCEMDKRHRVFVDFDGDVELHFGTLPDRTKTWLTGLTGEHEVTDGPIWLDYTVALSEASGPKTWHVGFTVRGIVVLESVMSKLLSAAVSIAETVTAVALTGDLVALLEKVDPIAAGDGLDAGVKELGQVLVGLGAVEAYENYRRSDDDRAAMMRGTSYAIARHLIGAMLEAVTHVSFKVTGATWGAAVGAALLPAHGAVMGAIIGAAALGLVGKALYEHVTVNWGTRLTMKRIARLTRRKAAATDPEDVANLGAKQDEQEASFLKHVFEGMRHDHFAHLDEFVEQVHQLKPEEKTAFTSLELKIEERLRYEVLNHHDELMGKKLAQVRAAFHTRS